MAVLERWFLTSVFNWTLLKFNSSKQCFNNRYLHSVFTLVRQTDGLYQVQPISKLLFGTEISKKRVLPTIEVVSKSKTTKGNSCPLSFDFKAFFN